MKISVVIPAFNEEKLLPASLQSVRRAMQAFTSIGWNSELVVCDNNSTDRTAEIAQRAGAHVVFEPVNQISRARNAGAAHAEGEWIIFIDADSEPSPELFLEVAATIDRGDCLAGGCTLKLDGRYPIGTLITKTWNLISRWRRWAAGSFIFCERAAFRELGGFSEALYVSEEIEFFRRLKRLARRRGRRIVILHRHPLVTSARKLKLYSVGEHLRFVARTFLGLGRTFRRREDCQPWYDGRR